MKSLFVLCIVFFVLALPARSAELPKVEVFGGYAFSHTWPLPFGSSQNLNGWNTTITANVNKWLGADIDVSGLYQNWPEDLKVHTFMAGPRLTFRATRPVEPFFRIFAGVAYTKLARSGSISTPEELKFPKTAIRDFLWRRALVST